VTRYRSSLETPIAMERLVPVKGTAPAYGAGYRLAARFRADRTPMAIRLVLHRRPPGKHTALGQKLARFLSEPPLSRPRLTAAEFERIQSPDPDHVRALSAYAEAAGLEVTEISRARHDMTVAGRPDKIASAFGVQFEMLAGRSGSIRAHRGEIQLPRRLHGLIKGILGLDELPRHRPETTLVAPGLHRFSPLDLAGFYRFPAATGRGQRIAILAFGGGFHREDLDHYFRQVLRIDPPGITEHAIGGASNDPMPRARLAKIFAAYNAPDATIADMTREFGSSEVDSAKNTLETTMDIQIAGAVANGAAIDVIFAPPDAKGFYEAIYTALGLGPVPCERATVISISWGASEEDWASHMDAIASAIHAAALRGVTLVASSGDFGSANHPAAPKPQVNFPASSPYALACGGTSLRYDADGRPVSEVAWNNPALGQAFASGGGVSGRWFRPAYQRDVKVPRGRRPIRRSWRDPEEVRGYAYRGLPDVAAASDMDGGYRVVLGGVETTGAGTSAATPLWAGLVARLNESLGRPLGWIHPILYQPRFRRTFHDVVKGNNRLAGSRITYYRAASGWDACTGIGSPDGEALLKALRAAKGATSPVRSRT